MGTSPSRGYPRTGACSPLELLAPSTLSGVLSSPNLAARHGALLGRPARVTSHARGGPGQE
eukprot:9390366-Pyramimonas_sp.AAC.1